MKYFTKLFIINSLLLSASCSTMKDSLTIGVISGAAAGAVGASSFSHTEKSKKAVIGAATGALIGGIASYLIHGSLEKRDARVRRKTLFNLENFGITEHKDTWKIPQKINRGSYE